jgi:predicted  nucleic acid-binding Zn-ribbon protein
MNLNHRNLMKVKLVKVFSLALLLALFGCGESADTSTPVAEMEEEAQTLSVDDLKAKAQSYQEAIAAKMKELEPIREKLAEIPVMEQMGDEAEALKGDLQALQGDLNALKERLDVYLAALKEKGESVQQYMQ